MPQPDETPILPEDVGMKSVGAVTLGDEARGEVTAVVATFDQVDNDGEVILSGALPTGTKVTVSSYNHDTVMGQVLRTDIPDQAPVGKGIITIEGKQAVARMNYFMETQRGREAFLTVKAMGADQAWSFTYRRKAEPASEEWRAKGARTMLTQLGPLLDGAMEVSPVKQPGGKGTGTVAVKQAAAPTPTPEPPKIEADPALDARLARVKRQIGSR